MKLIKKILASALIAAMTVSLFSGCQNVSTQTGEGNVTLELDLNKLPDMKIKNKSVVYYYPGTQNDINKNLNMQAALSILKEKYGVEVKFEFAPAQSYATRLTALVAGGNAPDLVESRDNADLAFIRNKLIQPLGKHFDYDSELWSEMKQYAEYSVWNGAQIDMPLEYNVEGTFVYFNKKLFDEAGLDYPTDYVERGEWTWDTMLKLAQQLTVMGADGNPTVYGYNDYSGYSLASSAGMDIVTQDENGRFVGNLENPVMTETMNFYYDLGVRKYNVLLQERPDSAFPAGRVAMVCDNPSKLAFFKDMLDYIDIAPIPARPGSSVKNVFAKMKRSPFLCAGAQNIDGAVAYINCRRLVEDTGDTKENRMAVIKSQTSITESATANAIIEKMVTMYEEGYESIEPRATKTLYSGVSNYWDWTKKPTQPWSTFVASWKNIFEKNLEELNTLCEALK